MTTRIVIMTSITKTVMVIAVITMTTMMPMIIMLMMIITIMIRKEISKDDKHSLHTTNISLNNSVPTSRLCSPKKEDNKTL